MYLPSAVLYNVAGAISNRTKGVALVFSPKVVFTKDPWLEFWPTEEPEVPNTTDTREIRDGRMRRVQGGISPSNRIDATAPSRRRCCHSLRNAHRDRDWLTLKQPLRTVYHKLN